MRKCGTWYALLYARADVRATTNRARSRTARTAGGAREETVGTASIRDRGLRSCLMGVGRLTRESYSISRAGPSSGATAGLRQVDRLVHEHGVLARAPALGVLGIDVHDRALPPDGAGKDGHPDEARWRIGGARCVDGLPATLEPGLPGLDRPGRMPLDAQLHRARDQAANAA